MNFVLKKSDKKVITSTSKYLSTWLSAELLAIAEREIMGVDSKLHFEKAVKDMLNPRSRYGTLERMVQEIVKELLDVEETRKLLKAEIIKQLRNKETVADLAEAMVSGTIQKIRSQMSEPYYD